MAAQIDPAQTPGRFKSQALSFRPVSVKRAASCRAVTRKILREPKDPYHQDRFVDLIGVKQRRATNDSLPPPDRPPHSGNCHESGSSAQELSCVAAEQWDRCRLSQFLLVLLLFFALHMIPAIPNVRARLVALAGRRAYLVVYSLVSLLMLGWVFHAAMQLDYVVVWDPAAWQAWFPIVLTPIAIFLLLAGLFSVNPASVSLRGPAAEPGAITAITRHPVFWGFALWAGSHLIPNGDLRSLLLFGSFFAFALLGIWMTERRARRRLAERWGAITRKTSIIPLVAMMSGRAQPRLDGPLIAGALCSAAISCWLLLGGHTALFGADPLAMTTL